MMKDMKWKQIDTTYAGKAYQVEAEEINLHGEVNIEGDLKVNGGSVSTPTAAEVPYDNTVSGLSGDDVQDATDELARNMVKRRNFNSLQDMATFVISNYSTICPILAHSDSNRTWVVYGYSTGSVLGLYTMARSTNAPRFIAITNDGTTTSGWQQEGGGTATAVTTAYDSNTYELLYI